MASVKLVNGNPHHHHHSLYSHHHPFLHHHIPLVTPPSPAAPGHSHTMTLDYSLPNRSRLGDADQSELTSKSIGHVSDISRPDSHQSYSDSNGNNQCVSPRPNSLPLSPGSDQPETQESTETPTKKNKRKLSEPRKRSDIGGVNQVDSSRETNSSSSESDDDDNPPPEIKIPKIPSQNRARVSNGSSGYLEGEPKPSNSTSKYKTLNSSRKKTSTSPCHHDQPSSSSTPTPSSSSSSSSAASPSPSLSQATTTQPDNKTHDTATSALPNGIPPPFLHPFLSAVPPAAAFGLVPGLYFGGQPYPPAAIPSTFPAIPLHLQQSYLAAAAAAAAQSAGSTNPSSSSSPPTSTPSSSSHPHEKIDSSPYYKHRDSSPHPVILQPPQILNNHLPHKPTPMPPGGVAGPPSASGIPASSSSSSSNHHGASRPSLDNQIDLEDDDDDASSQAHSPEDLSVGGKMSRKHRKNYKNMTRERRVEANARERTRVHTISAAFEALRRAVPSYSYNQKLSKLAILRIACSYIMSLARLADLDYTSASEHIQKALTFAECVDMCTSTIQTEGRARRRH